MTALTWAAGVAVGLVVGAVAFVVWVADDLDRIQRGADEDAR